MAAPGNISCFFKERAVASEKMLRKKLRLLLNIFFKEKCAAASENYVHLRNILK